MAEDKGLHVQMELYGFDIDKRHTSTCTLRSNPVIWIIFKNCTVLSNCVAHEREREREKQVYLFVFGMFQACFWSGQSSIAI